MGQLMHCGDALPIVDHETAMQDVLISMTSKGFGIAAVTKGGTLTGVITDGDLRRHMETLMSAKAGEVAGKDPVTVTSSMFAGEALNIMNSMKISVLLAVDDENKPIGIIHIHDLLRAGVA